MKLCLLFCLGSKIPHWGYLLGLTRRPNTVVPPARRRLLRGANDRARRCVCNSNSWGVAHDVGVGAGDLILTDLGVEKLETRRVKNGFSHRVAGRVGSADGCSS